MKNIVIILLFIVLVLPKMGMANDRKEIRDFEKGEIRALMFKITDWQNQHTEHVAKYRPLNWHLAAYYIGVMKMYKATGEKKYFNQMLDLGEKYNWSTEDDIYDAELDEVFHMYGPGEERNNWNNTGVYEDFTCVKGEVQIPKGKTTCACIRRLGSF